MFFLNQKTKILSNNKKYIFITLIFLIYIYILLIINVILKYDLYSYFILKNLKIHLNTINNMLTYQKISGFNNQSHIAKIKLINDFLETIKEIKILLSCFDLIYLNLKYIPVYKSGLYYGISNRSNGLFFIPSSSGLKANSSNLFNIIFGMTHNNKMDYSNLKLLEFGLPNIQYSCNIQYSNIEKIIFIKNLKNKTTDTIKLSDINSNNSIDIIQKILFIILNCKINLV